MGVGNCLGNRLLFVRKSSVLCVGLVPALGRRWNAPTCQNGPVGDRRVIEIPLIAVAIFSKKYQGSTMMKV